MVAFSHHSAYGIYAVAGAVGIGWSVWVVSGCIVPFSSTTIFPSPVKNAKLPKSARIAASVIKSHLPVRVFQHVGSGNYQALVGHTLALIVWVLCHNLLFLLEKTNIK